MTLTEASRKEYAAWIAYTCSKSKSNAVLKKLRMKYLKARCVREALVDYIAQYMEVSVKADMKKDVARRMAYYMTGRTTSDKE